jgi:ankyrin repeat protein
MYCNENNLNKLIELLKNNSIDIHRDNENMFLLACKNGNLDIVKYLIINAEKYSGKKINIHIKGNCVFNNACMNNHVNIVKYLMTIAEDYSGKKIDINYNNDEAFAYAYIKNNIDIVRVLIKNTHKYSNKPINIHSYCNMKHFMICNYGLSKVVLFGKSIGCYITGDEYMRQPFILYNATIIL